MGFFKPNVEQLRAKGDIDGLTKALKHEERDIRLYATVALGEIGDRRAVESLIQALKDEDKWEVRCRVAEALGKIGDGRAVESLIQALKDKDGYVRSDAAEALGEIGDRRAVESLIQALKDKDGYVRSDAAEALGKIGDKRAVEPLAHSVNDKSVDFRKKVIKSLSKIKNAKAVEALIQTLEDKSPEVRRRAAEALGEIGDDRAVKPLIQALEDSSDSVRKYAAKALDELHWEPSSKSDEDVYFAATVGSLINRLRTSRDKDRREDAARALASVKDKRVAKALIEVIEKETDKYVRKAAFGSLGIICAPVVDTLVIQTRYDDPTDSYIYYEHFVHRDAAKLIEKIDDIDALIRALGDSDADVRKFASKAIGELGDRRAVELLKKALNDEDKGVREVAKEASKNIQRSKES